MQQLDYGATEAQGLLGATSRRPAPSYIKIIVASMSVLMLGFVVAIHSKVSEQQHQLEQLEQFLHATTSSVAFSHHHYRKKPLPTKFAVEHLTPLKTQDHRGTCWAFASVGVLEQTYRDQGIKHGWLEPNEYLPLSEQAYGKEILRLCSGTFDSPQAVACRIPGDSIWQNSTEGGEAAELYYLVNGLKDNAYPHSICPYFPSEGHDSECPALTEEARETNPLKFEVTKMETYYDDLTVREKLYEAKQSMTFTTAIPYITHYYPCIGEFRHDPRCNPDSPNCALCPQELSITTCCIPLTGGQNYNMAGEFIASNGMTVEGGHVMVLAGYNDAFRTKNGETGGYILKNSWFDGIDPPLGPKIPRGSHSLRYWMQEISDWEERVICPNSHSPYNWYQCGNANPVTHAEVADVPPPTAPIPFNRSLAFREGIAACLSNETKLYAKLNYQPLVLKCTDADFCTVDDTRDYCKKVAVDGHSYFHDAPLFVDVRNATEWGDGMTRMCLFDHDTVTNTATDLCLPPMVMRAISRIFAPVEVRENDPDRCGYYFFPYEVVRKYVALFEGFYVNSFDIKWHPQSYAANQEDYPDLNYTFVKESTKTQKEYPFDGPFPFARVVT